MLLALSQAVWAEPVPNPAEETAESTTTTQSRSTYDWEAETDIHGVTLYPPPPDVGGPGNDGPTTTTVRTSRTSTPFRVNPDHPEDVYTGALPQGALPNHNVVVTDIYGNEITLVITAPPTTETTTEEPAAEEESAEEPTEEPETPARPFNWTAAIIAGGALVAAAAGGIVVLTRSGDDDDYIYEDDPQEEPPEE